ncbi:MAG TPA: MFS transporter [Candidatus Saccharimonadales bacterium]|nr:MFS transporter [Candidatus Saccharimonadales bacterium]
MMNDQDTMDFSLTPRLTRLLALACGLIVANLYYSQPLLAAIAATFHTSSGTSSLAVTYGQLGYVAGIAFLVPLGDIMNRRKLVISLLSATTVALFATASAPNLTLFLTATLIFSLSTVAALVLVPLAASLAAPEKRGQVIGTIMTGILAGVLLARTVSGVIAQVSIWRAVYFFASFAMLCLVIVLAKVLPKTKTDSRLRYAKLLRSIGTLVREEPLLRERVVYGFLSFAGFSVLWTSLVFLLAKTYKYNEATIGLFGMAGLAGVLIAERAGKLIDAGREHIATFGFLTSILLGWLCMFAANGRNLGALLVGIVLLDLGVQGAHVLNQGVIYRLRPEARSRLTTVYMTTYFLGGVVGSFVSGQAYARWGWPGVCFAGIGFASLALSIRTARGQIDVKKQKIHTSA